MASVAHIIRRRRARQARQQQRRSRRGLMITVLAMAFVLLAVVPIGGAVALGGAYYSQLTAAMPVPQQSLEQAPSAGTSELYDRTGTRLLWAVEDPLGDEREWLTLADLSPALIEATLLREDPDFLQTAGFAPVRAAERLIYNALDDPADGPLAADPTLTGRLVRNIIAPPPDVVTADYRAQEYTLVAELQRRYPPEALLEWHLNTNYYGHNAYGIDAAAQVYFGKRATDLTLDEIAMLAAIPTAPQYNPLDDETAARGRQAETLRALLDSGHISQADFTQATSTLTPLVPDEGQRPLVAAEYAVYARNQTEQILDANGYDGARLVSRGGLRITTALDMNLYSQMNCLLGAHQAQLRGVAFTADCPALGYLPDTATVPGVVPDAYAGVILEPNSGELLAAVGEITVTDRQPGAVLVPFVYLRAFRGALTTPSSMVLDIPHRFPGAADGLIYTPMNTDGSFSGPMSVREALSKGLLPPAVQVTNTEGLDSILRMARQIGMSSLRTDTYDLSLLERGGRVSVLDVGYAYTVLANLGRMHGVSWSASGRGDRPRDPVAVLRIEDANGQTLWDYETERAMSVTPIMDAGLAFLVNDILADQTQRAAQFGIGNVTETTRPAALIYGAGGDSQQWTVGYSPDLVTAVWLGRGDEAPFSLGLAGAPTAWRAVTEFAHDQLALPPAQWERPENITEARVCERSGLRPNEACPQRTEIFLDGTQPRETDPYWQALTVNTQTGRIATANTPSSAREERVFFSPPAAALSWWEDNQLPLPPETFDTLAQPDSADAAVILRPAFFDYVSGEVDVRGSMNAENLQYYQLAYGEGLNPSAWIDITGQRTDYTPGRPLALWDTDGLEGLYNLRLTTVSADSSVDSYVIQVTVDSVPPTIELSAPAQDGLFTFLNDDVIPLTADAQDNIAIDYVEFYHNGEFVGVDEAFPFGYEHTITRAAQETFSAVAFDAAGNQANSELVIDVLRGGT